MEYFARLHLSVLSRLSIKRFIETGLLCPRKAEQHEFL